MGIPTFSVTRKGFEGVVSNAFAGLGFTADASQYVFPLEMFLVDSDLTPLKENIDKIIYGLTKWESKIKGRGAYAPPGVTIQGKDYAEAAINMNIMFLRNKWGDGLPLLPATEERVELMLRGTDLSRDTVVGAILPRGGIATIESLAVSLVMAGGRAEYMPILIAAIQAIIEPSWSHQSMNATTCSVFPAVIVNGPVARQIRLNSGYGLLGPSSEYPAGASIGRAIRLILQNIGGAIPGAGTMATYGGMRYTNAVFAEDENGLPPGWKTLGIERGFPQGANIVTVLPVASATNVSLGVSDISTSQQLFRTVGFMRTPNTNAYVMPRGPDVSSGVLLVGRGWAKELAKLGWSKEKLKEFLWENSKLPWSEAERSGLVKRITVDSRLPKGEPAPLTKSPEDLMVVVAGGEQSGHAYWMQAGVANGLGSKEIKLPAKWDELLEQAKNDLGPLPG